MLFGGLFLYLSYYGCDQSQAQRLLTTSTAKEAKKSLLINGSIRFLLVLTYCAIGILLIPFLLSHPDFLNTLQGKQPDFLLPYFLIEYIPSGILGLLIAGFFAASMSSIDSALNSLSAATYQDFLLKIFPKMIHISDRKQLRISRWLTIFWGLVSTGFALQMIGGSETVLELVNKVGSAFYGPILATFWLGMLTKRSNQQGTIIGLIIGVGFNIFLWQFYGSAVSWLWWNVFGFFLTFGIGYVISGWFKEKEIQIDPLYLIQRGEFKSFTGEKKYYYILILVFILILVISKYIQSIF